MKELVSELVAICRVFGVFERAAVCCGTVSVPQCVALQALLEGDHDSGELALHMGVSTSATTRLVDGLEARGFLRRERGEDDRRRVSLKLTAEGRREAQRLRALTEQMVSKVMAHVPKAKRVQVLDTLRILRVALEGARSSVSCCSGDRRRSPVVT